MTISNTPFYLYAQNLKPYMDNYGIATFGVTIKSVIFETIMAVTIKIPVSWNVT